MPVQRSTIMRPLVAVAMVVASSLYAIAQQPPSPTQVRGTGEGSRPFDLRPNSTMTNATVAQTVAGSDGHTLLIKYKDGEKKVVVAPDTPVVTYVPADKSELKAGAKVIAAMKKLPDGSLETNRVSVGLDGLTPPM